MTSFLRALVAIRCLAAVALPVNDFQRRTWEFLEERHTAVDFGLVLKFNTADVAFNTQSC
jgi:hypothetical protein